MRQFRPLNFRHVACYERHDDAQTPYLSRSLGAEATVTQLGSARARILRLGLLAFVIYVRLAHAPVPRLSHETEVVLGALNVLIGTATAILHPRLKRNTFLYAAAGAAWMCYFGFLLGFDTAGVASTYIVPVLVFAAFLW